MYLNKEFEEANQEALFQAQEEVEDEEIKIGLKFIEEEEEVLVRKHMQDKAFMRDSCVMYDDDRRIVEM